MQWPVNGKNAWRPAATTMLRSLSIESNSAPKSDACGERKQSRWVLLNCHKSLFQMRRRQNGYARLANQQVHRPQDRPALHDLRFQRAAHFSNPTSDVTASLRSKAAAARPHSKIWSAIAQLSLFTVVGNKAPAGLWPRAMN